VDQDLDEELYMISCYKMDEEERENSSDKVRVESRKLLIYNGIVNNICLQTIADSGTTGQAISDRIIDDLKSVWTFHCKLKSLTCQVTLVHLGVSTSIRI